MNRKFVLASGSPRRKEILSSVGLEFDIVIPDVDETFAGGESPGEFALRLSREKALSVSRGLKGEYYVIGADTIVVADDLILGKPSDEIDAALMLNTISGKEHTVSTAFTITKPKHKVLHSEIVTTRVSVKSLEPHEIQGYIKTGECMDKAGAYAIQGIGAFMVRGIEGSYTNVVGLPLVEVLEALKKIGFGSVFSE